MVYKRKWWWRKWKSNDILSRQAGFESWDGLRITVIPFSLDVGIFL